MCSELLSNSDMERQASRAEVFLSIRACLVSYENGMAPVDWPRINYVLFFFTFDSII